MANTKEIKDRIKSVRDTQKITNAMYLIASTKMRKAKSELDHTRPYFEAIKGEIKRIFRTSKKDAESRWFYPEDDGHALTGPYACLVVTADKGLAGMYNQNVIREAEKLLKEAPRHEAFRSRRVRTAVLRAPRHTGGAKLPLHGAESYDAPRP